MRTAACLSLVALLAGCSSNGATVPTSDVAITPMSAPSASASSGRGARELAPAFRFGEPKLLGLVPVDSACISTERISSGRYTSHSYEVHAPSLAQADLERAFRAGAKQLGYAIGPALGGVGFRDESRAFSATLGDASIRILETSSPTLDATMAAVMSSGAETASLVDDLVRGAFQYDVMFERSSGGLEISVEILTTQNNTEMVDTWAKAHALTPQDRGWLRKLDDARPDVHSVLIDVRDANVSVREYVGGIADCASHPSRNKRVIPAPQPSESEEFRKEQIDLLKEMMDGG